MLDENEGLRTREKAKIHSISSQLVFLLIGTLEADLLEQV